MSDSAPSTRIGADGFVVSESGPGPLTPAGLQRRAALLQRRALLIALWGASLLGLGAAVVQLMQVDGWTAFEIGIAACVMASAIFVLFSFWTGLIGFAIRRLHPDPIGLVAPHWRDVDAAEPIRERTALLMTIRNEDPRRAFRRLLAVRASLDEEPEGAMIDLFILSDTDDPEIAAEEERLVEANRAAFDGLGKAHYRRRANNAGYKAGNIRDWLERWGDDYVFMAPLDADSVISGQALRRAIRVIQRHPRLGLLQYLCVGAPTTSSFARLVQFGLRVEQLVSAIGSAWWQGDSATYWGHNAVVRVAPFKHDCELPELKGAPPLGGPILSHDHIEAMLMRRAGYEVRVIPVEAESWEDTPVTLPDFLGRETRWANGNMQYIQLLGLPGLSAINRLKLFQLVMTFISPAAWMMMILLAGLAIPFGGAGVMDPDIAVGLFAVMLLVSLSPKLIGALDIALENGAAARRGGRAPFALSALGDIVFGALLAPIVALHVTVFLLGLPFGRRIEWGGQRRDAYRHGYADAARALWPQTLFGLALTGAVAALAPGALPFAAPVLLGFTLAIPLSVWTASPALERFLRRRRLSATPDEIAPPPILRAVATTPLREIRAVDLPEPAR